MTKNVVDDIVGKYIQAQQELIETERVDERTTVLSLPLHFSANTRIEIAVTQITPKSFLLSDMAQTIGELQDAGYSVRQKLKDRIIEITKLWQIKIEGNNLVRQCTAKELGIALHEFAEAAKTVGDAYLTYRTKSPDKDEQELKDKIRRTFQDKRYLYRETQNIRGDIESHIVDFYIPPNGANGLALEVIPSPNRLTAEAWGFKSQDIKRANKKMVVGVIYDAALTKEVSRTIIDRMADIPLPTDDLGRLAQTLEQFKISTGGH